MIKHKNYRIESEVSQSFSFFTFPFLIIYNIFLRSIIFLGCNVFTHQYILIYLYIIN